MKGAMAMEIIPKSRYPGDPPGPGLRFRPRAEGSERPDVE